MKRKIKSNTCRAKRKRAAIRKTVKIKKATGIVKKVNIASKVLSASNRKCVKKATKSKSLNIAPVPPISPITKEKHSKRNRHIKG